MTKNKGVHIALDIPGRIVRVLAWGVWDVKTAREFQERLRAQSRKLDERTGEWYLLMDITKLSTPSKEVHELIEMGLMCLSGRHIFKRAILSGRSITHFQPQHPPHEAIRPVYSYFRSEDEAVRWLVI